MPRTIQTESGKEIGMKEVFEQYGGVIITIIAIIALLTIIYLLMQNDEDGIVYKAFTNALSEFYDNAGQFMRLPDGE